MRPLTIFLLAVAITACFVATMTHDGQIAGIARVAYGLAFVGAIVAFAHGLPRIPEEPRQVPTGDASRLAAPAHG